MAAGYVHIFLTRLSITTYQCMSNHFRASFLAYRKCREPFLVRFPHKLSASYNVAKFEEMLLYMKELEVGLIKSPFKSMLTIETIRASGLALRENGACLLTPKPNLTKIHRWSLFLAR